MCSFITNLPFSIIIKVSKKGSPFSPVSMVNLIVGWMLLSHSKNVPNSSLVQVKVARISSRNLFQINALLELIGGEVFQTCA